MGMYAAGSKRRARGCHLAVTAIAGYWVAVECEMTSIRIVSLLVAALSSLAPGRGVAGVQKAPAVVIYQNGKIVTLDDHDTVASAVAVRDVSRAGGGDQRQGQGPSQGRARCRSR